MAILLKVCVGVFIVTVFAGLRSQADDSKEYEEISNKKIKEQLEILTNEVKKLKLDVADLKGEVQEGKDEEEDADNEGFKLLEASRHLLPDGRVKFQVSYRKKKDTHVTQRWSKRVDFHHSLIEDFGVREEDTDPSDGHCRVDSWVFVENSNDIHVICELDPGEMFVTVFMKGNTSVESVTDTDLEIPILKVSPPKEIVYQPNENVTLEVTVPEKQKRLSPGHPGMSETYRLDFIVLEPGATKVRNHIDTDDFFQQIKLEKFLDRQTMKAELNTAEFAYSGLMHFYSLKHYEDKLVYTIQKGVELELRSADQEGPFPVGKVYPLERRWIDKDADGTPKQFCSIGEKCSTSCIFIGEDISNFRLEKTVNGVKEELPMEIYANASSEHKYASGTYEWDVPSDVFSEVLTCVASAGDSGETVRDPTRFYYGQKVEMLRNDSHKEIFPNRSALVTCAASGQPRPTVTIDCDEKSPQVVLYQTEDVTAVSKLCGEWGWTECTATNNMTRDQIWNFDEL